MKEAADSLIAALRSRFGFETLQQDVRPNQIRLLGRVPPEGTRNWVLFRQHILDASQQKPWTYDGSRPDLLRGGALVWAWRLIFQHENLKEQVPSIIEVIQSSPRAKFEVEEQRLSVMGPRQVMNSRGKGASSAGAVPMLVAMRSGAVR